MIPLSGRAACTVTCPLELPSPDKLQGATIALKCQKYLEADQLPWNRGAWQACSSQNRRCPVRREQSLKNPQEILPHCKARKSGERKTYRNGCFGEILM